MKIKFKKPDPRAGTIARMDSSRGQHFIDIGCAVLLKENEDASTEAEKADMAPTREVLDREIAGLPGENTDPDYVVRAMRRYFGDTFTDADETRVRELVKPAEADKPTEVETVLVMADQPADQPEPSEQQAKGSKKGKGA
ncbi:hypothetical protein Tamer19_17290 [Cupriavidus sp. TA19]|uniref:hypothetical protein n=1 Tax=unclassified Cupriavidus TaxID=2640874 RepID=UPI0027294820|nr:hypothetical protein [Cupriavidus sp. TA19]GLC92321.1 hypothetical protein Tamer19_17290 [Cupriavidus sp. TA19]